MSYINNFKYLFLFRTRQNSNIARKCGTCPPLGNRRFYVTLHNGWMARVTFLGSKITSSGNYRDLVGFVSLFSEKKYCISYICQSLLFTIKIQKIGDIINRKGTRTVLSPGNKCSEYASEGALWLCKQ